MSARYVFGPLERRGVFLGARAGQVVVALVATTAVIATFWMSPTPAGAAIALVVIVGAVATTLVPVAGRTGDQWIPIVAAFLLGEVTGTHRWRSRDQLRGHRLVTSPGSGPSTIDDPAPPRRARDGRRESTAAGPLAADRWVIAVERVDGGDQPAPYLRGIEVLAARWNQGDVGVIRDAARRTYVGVIAAGGRSLALSDPDEKERLIAAWGGVLASAARDHSAITRLQWLERTVPDDSEGVVRHLRKSRSLPLTSPFVRSYLALLDEAGPQTQQHEVYLALQVSAARASATIRQLGVGVDVGSCEVLSRELDALAGRLRQAEVEVRGILSPRTLAGLLRRAADPTSAAALADRSSTNPEMVGATPRAALPRRSATRWASLATESTHHATYWVAEWPRGPVGTDWLAPLLLARGVHRSVSVCMEPVPPAVALRRVEAARLDDATTQSFRERFGFRHTVRRQREEENVARAEEELNEGHCYFRFSAYITVSAPTPAELNAACLEVEHQASQSGLDVRREYGTQAAAFTYTLPLCRGLR